MKQYTYEESLKQSLEYFKGNELAAKVWVDKYALRNKDDSLLESNPDQMHRRIAKEFARIEKDKFKKPLSEEEIYDLLKDFKCIVPAGSPMFGIGNKYQCVSLSNCYLLEIPTDNYNHIMEVDKQLVNISKRRGGVATDLSKLRPKGSPTQNAAKSSTGITSWMERYSNSTREVGQNSRRGACLLSLSIHHPDIIDFCTIKNDLTKVTGANISVRLSQEFIDALYNNKEYELRFPVDSDTPQISKMVKAKEVWDVIIKSSRNQGDPGLLFWNIIERDTPSNSYEDYKAQGVNACCFSVDQDVWVITNNGYKEIKTITKDDLIWCSYDDKFEKTSGYFKVGIHQTYKVKFDNGTELIITTEHKLGKYNYKNAKHYPVFTQLKDLKVGDNIYTNTFDSITNLLNFTQVSGRWGYEDFWTQIISIEPHKKEEVGCIEVENTHYFSANGIISSNSEIILDELSSCKLMSLNLLSFVDDPFTNKSSINYDKLFEYSKLIQRLIDDMIDLESEKIDSILKKVKNDPEPDHIKESEKRMWIEIKRKNDEGRRTGNGITGLGDTIAALGLKYGSNRSIQIVEEIYKTIKLGCYTSSVEMAKELGPFKDWDYNKEKKCPFLLRIKEDDPSLYKEMKQYGRRNIALLATAPAGTLSLLTQTTSGIEPLYELSHIRRRKINPEDKNIKVDFTDQNGDQWEEYTVIHPIIKKWTEATGKIDLEQSPWFGCCANDISPDKKIKLLSVAQKHTCHNISCTFNLPNSATVEDINKIYRMAIDYELKGVTVYRDGSRSGVLLKQKSFPNERPRELECDVHYISVKGSPFMVLVGLIERQPFEVFAVPNGNIEHGVKQGRIIKILRPKYYKAVLDDGMEISPINTMCNEYEDAITRLVSVGLQNKTDIHKIVVQLEKVSGNISGFAKSIARALKKYIKDGTKEEGKCPECNTLTLVREAGCIICKSCGHSKCC